MQQSQILQLLSGSHTIKPMRIQTNQTEKKRLKKRIMEFHCKGSDTRFQMNWRVNNSSMQRQPLFCVYVWVWRDIRIGVHFKSNPTEIVSGKLNVCSYKRTTKPPIETSIHTIHKFITETFSVLPVNWKHYKHETCRHLKRESTTHLCVTCLKTRNMPWHRIENRSSKWNKISISKLCACTEYTQMKWFEIAIFEYGIFGSIGNFCHLLSARFSPSILIQFASNSKLMCIYMVCFSFCHILLLEQNEFPKCVPVSFRNSSRQRPVSNIFWILWCTAQ